MALTGIQIFKLLPNKNCGECGVPTCLAFAMKLAAKAVETSLCPYISEESLGVLSASQSPPIKRVEFSISDKKIGVGAETVMYRHEKTFLNQTLIALEVSDKLPDAEFSNKLKEIESYSFERVGMMLYPEGIALSCDSASATSYLDKYKILKSLDRVIILSKTTPEILQKVLEVENKPGNLVVNSVTTSNYDNFKDIIKGKDIKVVLESDTLESLFDLAQKAEADGLKNLVLKIGHKSDSQLLNNNVYLRRLSIKKNYKPAGYPLFTECNDQILDVITGICKYSSIVVLKKYDGATLFPLLTLRQGIYTDPQKPLQIQPGIYSVGEPTSDSPLLVTTNFSLTYFIVSGEVENSPFSARMLITDSEGMSVLTAWSAGKFSPGLIAKELKKTNAESEIKHRKIIIPGYVACIKGELEDEIADWEVLVGPQEACDIPWYLKEHWSA
ncbi:acetyl-CoA decarbonylase/synthase complex subunit gamma [Thermoproteota archaeon]